MLTETNAATERGSGFRIYVVVSVVVFVLALGYVGWVFWSRAHEAQLMEQRAAENQRAEDQNTFDSMGGSRFDILNFYATEQTIGRGDSVDLCYSVSNAKTVTLQPAATEGVWPSFERCVSASPKKTTTYTLTATDGAGHTRNATVTVEVR